MTNEQEALVTAHLKAVEHIASWFLFKLPRHVDRDELVAAGRLGLVEAACRFNPDRGVAFRTFAGWRILGAMQDTIRSCDIVSRRSSNKVDSRLGFMIQLHLDDEDFAGSWNLKRLKSKEDFSQMIFFPQSLSRALSSLPQRERYIIREHFYRGRSNKELAAELNISEAWTSLLKLRAIKRLKAELCVPGL